MLQVPQSIVTEVASEADRKKYASFALRSFVEDNRQLTWCPSPGEHPAFVVIRPFYTDTLRSLKAAPEGTSAHLVGSRADALDWRPLLVGRLSPPLDVVQAVRMLSRPRQMWAMNHWTLPASAELPSASSAQRRRTGR